MPWANASIVLNSRDRSSGTYNSCTFNAQNQNIIQGQIHSIAVSEINFPYDIPNVQLNVTDTFYIISEETTPPVNVKVELNPGFYTGLELATAINDAIAAVATDKGINIAEMPLCVYDDTSNTFSFTLDAPTIPNLVWTLASPYTFPLGATQTNTLGKDLFSMMGFLTTQDNELTAANSPFQAGGAAPMAYTQYIDVCSAQMCKFQRFRDGSTTNLARRADVICRLYIANNVATQEEEGSRPFVINRQFTNARVMKWTADNSVGTIDIQLYDDVGQPLTTTWQPRPYQITFNAYESDEKSDAQTGDAVENLLKKYAAYQPRNEQAWESSSFPISRK